jgi:tetratricopeptide (TPR) repeat protein
MALECLTEEGHRAIVARLCLAKARFSQGAPMRDCAQRALSLYQTLNDGAGAAHSSRTLAYSLLQMGRADEAEAMIACANAAFREQGDRAGMASCFGLEAVSAYNRGDFSRGRESYLLALAAYRELGDELSTANVLGNLAELEFADGRAERALECVNESLEITSQSKYATDVAILYNNMTAYRIALGQFDDALESAKKALHWAQPERNAWNVAVALQHFALLGGLLGQPTRAARLLGYVDVQYRSLGLEREATEQSSYEKLLASLNEQLKASDIQALAASGSTWSEDRAVKEALIIDGGCRTP